MKYRAELTAATGSTLAYVNVVFAAVTSGLASGAAVVSNRRADEMDMMEADKLQGRQDGLALGGILVGVAATLGTALIPILATTGSRQNDKAEQAGEVLDRLEQDPNAVSWGEVNDECPKRTRP